MFETAQWAHSSEAATSLAQMAARSASGDGTLAALVREWQDLVAEWQITDKSLIAAKSKTPDKRSTEGEKSLSDRLAAIDKRLAEIDARFVESGPLREALDGMALAFLAVLVCADVGRRRGAQVGQSWPTAEPNFQADCGLNGNYD